MKNFGLLVGIQAIPLALIFLAGVVFICDNKAGWGVFWILVFAVAFTSGNEKLFERWRDK